MLWKVAETFSPELLRWYQAYKFRRRVNSSFGSTQRLVRERFYPKNKVPCVLTGPFEGMRYIDEMVWGLVPPKWLGAYEAELADIVEEIIKRGYSRILNIGCAEGYYAVGLALRDRACEVFAFDIDPICRVQTRRLARLNEVSDQVHVCGECNHERLENLIDNKTLVLSDIEGYEVVLLDPERIPKLKRVDLLIEIHAEPSVGEAIQTEWLIIDRFASSHAIERRVACTRVAWIGEHQALWQDRLSREEISDALDEHRPKLQTWLWAKARE
jgi:hypothetical protein